MLLVDGSVSTPGAAVAAEPPTSLTAPEPTYGLTVSGRDVVTHVDPDFQFGVGPVGDSSRSTRQRHQPDRNEGDHK